MAQPEEGAAKSAWTREQLLALYDQAERDHYESLRMVKAGADPARERRLREEAERLLQEERSLRIEAERQLAALQAEMAGLRAQMPPGG